MSSQARERILARIREGLREPSPRPFPETAEQSPVYRPAGDDLDVAFAEAFVQLQGRFAFCLNHRELVEQLRQLVEVRKWTRLFCRETALRERLPFGWTDDLAGCEAAITTCEALVARTGSIVLSSAGASGRTTSVYAPVHICIAYRHQLVADIADAWTLLRQRYGGQWPSLISFASGPSRTADIEKTLVTGVHGPAEVYCFLVETP